MPVKFISLRNIFRHYQEREINRCNFKNSYSTVYLHKRKLQLHRDEGAADAVPNDLLSYFGAEEMQEKI